MKFKLIALGASRSFPTQEILSGESEAESSVLLIIGQHAGVHLQVLSDDVKSAAQLILVELGTEYLGSHTGEEMGKEGGNVLGFSRFRLGDNAPTDLVELVCQPASNVDAIACAETVFKTMGLTVVRCADMPGRIIDRLMRPYFNEALRRLDDGLAAGAEMDKALRLGLGYPRGPIESLAESGLAHHYDVSLALHKMIESPGFFPARRAQVAAAVRDSK